MFGRQKLRSAIWSSETLARGMASISQQPDGLMVKSEEDETMVNEYAVTYLEKNCISFCLSKEFSLLERWWG